MVAKKCYGRTFCLISVCRCLRVNRLARGGRGAAELRVGSRFWVTVFLAAVPRGRGRKCWPCQTSYLSYSWRSWMQPRAVGSHRPTRQCSRGSFFITKSGYTHGDTPVRGWGFVTWHRLACSTDRRAFAAVRSWSWPTRGLPVGWLRPATSASSCFRSNASSKFVKRTAWQRKPRWKPVVSGSAL